MNAIRSHVELMVDNVHCAGCISKIEGAVKKLPGVEQARLNMTTRRLAVDFRDGAVDAEAITATVSGLGYSAAPFRAAAIEDPGAAEERKLLLAMAVAGFAAGNVMLLSVSIWAGTAGDMGSATRDLFHWISALIALPAVAFSGRPFFSSAWRALRGRSMNMDVPISLAVILASAVSLYETVGGGVHAYFDAAVTLLFFLLIGRYLDVRARTLARSAASRLMSMAGDTARVISDDGLERVMPIAQVSPGMRVAVAPGEKVPLDGVVSFGASDIDASVLTGEATPEGVGAGSPVYAGTLNLTGPLTVLVNKAAGDTLLADIVRLMETAEQGRSAYVKMVDRVARFYSPSVHVLALATFIGWLAIGEGVRDSLLNAVAVLIITCPCALGLAVPVVRVVAHGLLFARGILVKSADALERLAQIDTVVFDKTGTLTKGELVLVERPDDATLALAAAVAQGSRHPLARAVADAGRGLILPAVDEVREVAGSGVEAAIDGRTVRLGRREWAAPEVVADDRHDGAELWLAAADVRQRLRFRDSIKDDAVEAVAALAAMGLHVCIVSGDRPAPVEGVARCLGIADWRANRRPDEKVREIARLATQGARVLMVGDGLNDAPALAAGFASASPAAAADISRTAADVVFQGTRLMPVVWMVKVARAARARMFENMALSIVYNAIAVPIAVAGLVTPLIAAAAMSSSSILVTLNAIRLKAQRL